MGSQSGRYGHGKHPGPAYSGPPGAAGTRNQSRNSELQVPKPSSSIQTPQVVIHSPSSLGSEDTVINVPDTTLVTGRPRYVPPSSVDIPGEWSGEIDSLLLENCHKHADGTGRRFWSLPVLEKIVTSQNVLRALESCQIKEHRAEQIAKVILQPPGRPRSSYIKVFAILQLCEKTSSIEDFLCPEDGVCDEDLPLLSTDNGKQLRKRDKEGELACFKAWKVGALDRFGIYQYQFCPHIFGITDKTRAPHFELRPEVILPFTYGEEMRNSSPTEERIGAFGEVFKYCIPPGCHGFDEILAVLHLKEKTVFAVKKLYRGNVSDFQRFNHETDQLKRFNGHISPHIVTLLATFIQNGEHYFVFPFAEGDLCKYWATQCPPKMNLEFARWFAVQLSGLMDAICSIHEPKPNKLLLPQEEKYGRHGDIKPDNILWYKSTLYSQGLFVISDLGQSALNSDKSRSNIESKNVPPVPGYRPPECDIEKPIVSRLFDVWTMGCLYLEMITWYLGGEELREEFDKRRRTTFLITGVQTNQFYNLENSRKGGGIFVQFVKPEVTNWINRLRAHPACTDFVHAVLEIIERQMIVILADPPKRAKSKELKSLFRDVRERCDKSESYCIVPNPRQISTHLEDAEVGICVKLNERVKHQMSDNITGEVFKGAELRSARREQLGDAE